MPKKEELKGKIYWVAADGSMKPEEAVTKAEKSKEEMFDDLFAKAKELQAQMKEFKDYANTVLGAYLETCAKRARVGGWKGNKKIFDYDGRRVIEVSTREVVKFDEKLSFAKAKFDEWILEKTENGDADLSDFIQKAFDVDSEGNINRTFLFKLLSFPVKHPTFKKAQELLRESMTVVDTKKYTNFKEREDTDSKLEQIVLDFAAL